MATQAQQEFLTGPRGRVDKRASILEAALEVFAEVGYPNANVDIIANRARVAKPTIYNHFGDKEQLFRTVIVEFGALVSETSLRAIEELSIRPTDLRLELERLGARLNGCFDDPKARAIYRLMVAEIIHFPDLIDEWRRIGPDRLTEALAGRFAMLANNGYLRRDDAVCTATQFVGLISNQIVNLSAFGTRSVSQEDFEGTIRSGVDTFLRAFALSQESQ